MGNSGTGSEFVQYVTSKEVVVQLSQIYKDVKLGSL
jgi:hypothetical protein